VGAVLLVSLGCDSFDDNALAETIRASGRPVHALVIQESGGTRPTVEAGTAWVREALQAIESTPRAELRID